MQNKKKYISSIILLVFFVLFYLPIINITYHSFFYKNQFDLTGYYTLFSNIYIITSFLSSMLIASIVTIASIMISIYTIKYFFLNGDSLFFIGFSLINLITPEIILAIAFFIFFNYASIPLGYTSLIISHIALALGYILPLLNQKWKEINKLYITVAYDLGATSSFVWKTIVLKLLKPTIITTSFLSFILSFDDYIFAYFCSGVDTKTLSNLLLVLLKNGLTQEVKALYVSIYIFSSLLAIFYTLYRWRYYEQ